ncbi:sulfotransferase family protein [Croceibacterium mercuriale]|uniref:sulfotransferase family protein n=1 Tax=Croceibacterium mercuriale TaxID=1572751 RepID=UPI00068C9E55|nr:sulfotransferase [Croceibacterium mercuriale]
MSRRPRPHLLARGPLVGRLDRLLGRLWSAGLCQRPSLDPAQLWAKALQQAPPAGEAGGRNAAEVADFRARLERLCAALVEEADLTNLGRTIAHGQLVRVLRQRLQLGALWLDRPELPVTPLAPPIIVVGHMRGGTTRVHRLLAADPAHAATRFCDSWHPVPPRSGRPDLRPLWSGLSLAFARRLDPWLDTIHPFGATRPDEELGWLATALDHCAYEAQWRIPGYSLWSEARDPEPVYAEFARLLATDAAIRGNADRTRVLKVPQFAEDLPALLARFPQARVVVARRAEEDVVASAVSLVANQRALQSASAELGCIEAECRRKVALRESRMAEALTGFAGPLAEVDFAGLDLDWEGEIGRAYQALGLPLTPAALAAMRAEQGRAARQPHHAHKAAYRSFSRRSLRA